MRWACANLIEPKDRILLLHSPAGLSEEEARGRKTLLLITRCGQLECGGGSRLLLLPRSHAGGRRRQQSR